MWMHLKYKICMLEIDTYRPDTKVENGKPYFCGTGTADKMEIEMQ